MLYTASTNKKRFSEEEDFMIRALSIFVPCLYLFLFGFLGLCFSEELYVFAGAASKPPTEEAAKVFEKKTGTRSTSPSAGQGLFCPK